MADVRRLPDSPRDDGLLAEGFLDGLLAGVVPEPPGPIDAVAAAVEAHREHARAWYGDLIGPLGVPARAAAQFVDTLRSSDHAMPIVMLGPWGRTDDDETLLNAARAQVLDDDRIELLGIELSLPGGASPAQTAEAALEWLDASGATWLRVPADPGHIEALDVIADDGAERVALLLPPPAEPAHAHLASLIQALASRRLGFCLSSAPGAPGIDLITTESAYGLLNLLCAVGVAVEPAEIADLAGNAERLTRQAALLAQTDSEAIIDQVRRIGAVTAGAIRSVLDRIACGSVRALVSDLEAAGLIVPDVA